MRIIAFFMTAALAATCLAGCGSTEDTAKTDNGGSADSAETSAEAETEVKEETEIQVFIAASLSSVMNEIAQNYNKEHPEVTISFNADSSGTLQTQIEEGYACDIFFSAAQKQMDALEGEGFVVEGTRANVVNNQVVVITYAGSETPVTGLADIGSASSIALADGSVPVGKYTRQAMVNAGMLPATDDASVYTTAEVSEALGGVEISEQSNVSKVLTAVSEQSCEVGTTYLSDTFGHEDEIEILEYVSYDLTGNVIYPVAQINNEEADNAESAAAADFLAYILSDEATEIFDHYLFDTNVER